MGTVSTEANSGCKEFKIWVHSGVKCLSIVRITRAHLCPMEPELLVQGSEATIPQAEESHVPGRLITLNEAFSSRCFLKKEIKYHRYLGSLVVEAKMVLC